MRSNEPFQIKSSMQKGLDQSVKGQDIYIKQQRNKLANKQKSHNMHFSPKK